MEVVNISGRDVSTTDYPYIIAEIGSNHNGDMKLCRKIIDSAVIAGADAVKFQSWTPSSLISKAEYARNTSYSDKKKHFGSLEQMVAKYAFSEEQHREIKAYCQEKNITFLSSAFSPEEVAMLESIDLPAHKLASMDINNIVLLKVLAETGKPIIVSTGMATLSEIDDALNILEKNNSGPIILLHCVSIYPPDSDMINLKNIEMLKMAFGKLVGFSDHSIGTAIPLASIALGATVLEKHFTIDQNMEGWDHAISANPEQLSIIVREGKHIFSALGSHRRVVSEAEIEKRNQFRRRIVISRPLNKGKKLTESDITFKRPGNGIPPNLMNSVIGRTLQNDVEADHELEWEDLVS